MTMWKFLGVFAVVASLLVFECGAAETTHRTKPPIPTVENGLCVIPGTPPSVPYTFIKKVKVAKATYGSADQIFLQLVEQARALGADAIVGYSGSQRFGFFPWRMVRPVVYGDAVKWNDKSTVNCESLGGKQY